MNRAQVIADLMSCLGSITLAAGFSAQPAAVLRGIHLVSELNELPALSMMNHRVEAMDAASGTSERTLLLHIWGAAKAAHSDYGALDNLAESVVAALLSPDHNPHWDRTNLAGMEVYEGGASDPIGLFDLQIRVNYEAALAVL